MEPFDGLEDYNPTMPSFSCRRSVGLSILRVTALLFVVGCAASKSTPSSAPPAAAELPMQERWPGIHLVWHANEPLKSVVVEFDDYLAVVEVPTDAPTVERMLSELRRRFPDKPVRYALHTHHHGHSVGALDPLFAAGITFVTTAWNLEQLRTLATDEAALAEGVRLVGETFELREGDQVLRAHVLRDSTYAVPTRQYVVVELPRARAVVSGCLYNKPLDYHEVINARKRAMDAFLTEQAPDTEWLVPTNTSRASGFEDVCSRAMLDETLRSGLDPERVAERVGRTPVPELEASFFQLVEEFRAKTPRGYDLLVCGNYLRAKQDHERALLLFRVATVLSPEDIDAYWLVAEAALTLGRESEARSALNRALELATDDADRAAIREQLAAID